MNRAMLSGVAGMKAHQTKMDVIGNNIANVNTYGYKSQRAIFSDIYYQTLRSASEGTNNKGGTNPSGVGYGSSLAAVQTQMTQSSMQNTGFGLDVAIMGEGFLQVMDGDGNIFYTKAGLLDYDSNGYLTDINGNFVLGAGSKDGKPGSQKIRLDNIGSVDAKKPSSTEIINGVEYTITASNASKYGNVGLTIGSSEKLPAGLKASATISPTGAVSVLLNAYEEFNSMSEVNDAINKAIREANGGKDHEAGTFTISTKENMFGKDAVSGSFLGSALADKAVMTGDGANFFGGALKIGKFEPKTAVNPNIDPTFTVVHKTGTSNPKEYNITAEVQGVDGKKQTYKGTVKGGDTTVELKAGDGGILQLDATGNPALDETALDAAITATHKATISAPAFLGGATVTGVSKDFPVGGNMGFRVENFDGTAGTYDIITEINGKEYKGTVSAAGNVTLDPVDADGVGSITMNMPSIADMKKNLGLADTATDTDVEAALNASAAGTKHKYQTVAKADAVNVPLTGAQIAGTNFGTVPGGITGNKVEDGFFGGGLTFMKTSNGFTGEGNVTPQDFTAKYVDDGTNPAKWVISLDINGKTYTAEVDEKTKASSLLLKASDSDYIQVSNPGFDGMNAAFAKMYPNDTLGDGKNMQARENGVGDLTVTPSTPSKDLGFSSTGFALNGGTEGGAITLDELSSVSVGSDGTIIVSHPEKGAVTAGKISLANFANTRGLQLEGNNYYSATANSGEPKLCDPGSDGSGILKNSALEMSNVDLAAEFADMITTQRGFQANSRIITVSDTMMEELINLKR